MARKTDRAVEVVKQDVSEPASAVKTKAGTPATPPRTDAELRAILRGQLDSPLAGDLLNFAQAHRRVFEPPADEAAKLGWVTFADLLTHPNPPIELLDLAKEFGQAHRSNPAGPIPDEVATVLYLAFIAAALVRKKVRIANMNPARLHAGLEWGTKQHWVDQTTKGLMKAAMSKV